MSDLHTREVKTFAAEIKAVEGEAGTFEAIVSVFGNKDLGGDIVMPGAFADTLTEWAAKGDPIPVIWSHEWDDPEAHIGYCMEARETETGLYVKAHLDVDRPFAEQVHHLLKSRRVTQFSFGYFADEVKWVEDPDTGRMSRELHKLSVFEVGPTLLGMNPATQLLNAASALGKAGRVLSGKNEQTLRQAYDLIGQVLQAVAAEEDGKSADPDQDTDPSTDPSTDPGTDSGAAGDTGPTVDIERAQALLVRTRYERN